jgi:hypothetical protein
MEHPSYSPHFALNCFWLFPKIKSALKGWNFLDNEYIKKWRHWKLFHNRSSKNSVSNSGSIVGLSE